MSKYLSIDIGGTDIKYAILDQTGKVLDQDKINTIQDKENFLSSVDQIVNKYIGKIDGIAFCAPGKIENNTIHFGGSLPFLDGVNFAKRYQNLKIPVAVINDGKASVLAENWLGSLKGIEDCASVTLGTGVGGGIIVNGKLLNGFHSQAGELSFMQLDLQDETMTGMAGGYASAVKMIEGVNKAVGNTRIDDGFAAFDAIKNGDAQAQQIFKTFCKRIAFLILNLQSVVDLQKIAIAGGISAQPTVIESINNAYDEILSKNDLLRTTLIKPEIVVAKFKNNANILGALRNLLN